MRSGEQDLWPVQWEFYGAVSMYGRFYLEGISTYVQPYARHMSHGLRALDSHLSAAIRAPRASPSNVSVNHGQLPILKHFSRGERLTMKHDRNEQNNEFPSR